MAAGAANPTLVRKLSRAFCLALAAAGLLFEVGCANDNRLAGDPLLGGVAPTPPGPAKPPPAPGAAPTTAAASAAPLPALPAPDTAASNAALAAGSQPLDAAHDLRIADPRRPQDGKNWSGPPAAGTLASHTGPAPPLPATPVSAPTASAAASSRIATYEQAQAQLAARGVIWQRLESAGDQGGWKFSCSIPNPQNRAISHTYEAQAVDYLSAIRAVLDQIGKDH
jgi:hypothetical protein